MHRLLVIAVFGLAFTVPCVAIDSENIQIVEAMIDAVNDRNLGALDNYGAPDVVRHSAATPEVVVTNLDEFRDFLTADISTIPDSIQEIDIIFGAGE